MSGASAGSARNSCQVRSSRTWTGRTLSISIPAPASAENGKMIERTPLAATAARAIS